MVEEAIHQKGVQYETFMKRAHKYSHKSSLKEAKGAFYVNLLSACYGTQNHDTTTFEQQFEEVKSFLSKAFEAFIRRRIRLEDKQQLQALRERLARTFSLSDLDKILSEGLQVTYNYQ